MLMVPTQAQTIVASIARLVTESSTLDTLLARAAVLLAEGIPFERLHLLRLDRSDTVTLYLASAAGEMTVISHQIADGGAAPDDRPSTTERSRIVSTVGQASGVQGAVWLTSTQANAFSLEHRELLEAV